MRALKEEFFKSRRKHTFLIVLAFAVIELLWLLWSFRTGQKHEDGWFDILYNIPVLDGVICPIFAAVMAGQNADLEHRGGTYKMLFTMQKRTSLFNAKAAFGAMITVLFFALQTANIFIIGMLYKFSGLPPYDKILLTAFLGFLVTMAVYLLQLDISMTLKNQFVPFAVGVAGSFCGMFLLFLPYKLLRELVLWGNYGALSLVILDWDYATRTGEFYWQEPDMIGITIVIVWLMTTYILGLVMSERKEV